MIRDLHPYTPGEQPQDQQYIKLNTNENPYPPSPKVLQAIKDAANDTLRLYPDPQCGTLRRTIAEYYDLKKEQVFVGNGSDEVLALVFLTFFKQKLPLLFPDVTYSFYQVYCQFFDIQPHVIPVRDDFTIQLADYAQPNGGIIFANPNAMTGRCVEVQAIQQLLHDNTDSVVAIDEAYVDFGGESVVPLIPQYPNLLVTQTLSKSRSLAGLRLGIAMGNEELIDGLERAKDSFNSYTLDRLALAGSVAAMQDEAHYQDTRQRVMRTREWVSEELRRAGFTVIPSLANFIMVQHPTLPAEHVYSELRAQGILVRYFKNQPRVQNFVRVSIGTDAEMEKFLNAIRELT